MIAPYRLSQDLSQSKNTQRRSDSREFLERLKKSLRRERERERKWGIEGLRQKQKQRLAH